MLTWSTRELSFTERKFCRRIYISELVNTISSRSCVAFLKSEDVRGKGEVSWGSILWKGSRLPRQIKVAIQRCRKYEEKEGSGL